MQSNTSALNQSPTRRSAAASAAANIIGGCLAMHYHTNKIHHSQIVAASCQDLLTRMLSQ
jgi:hypothetical protein